MKEATGELNATVVVILAIGVLMAFFYYTLWPMIRQNFVNQTNCGKAICEKCDSNGDGKADTDCEMVTCYSKGDKDHAHPFECVYKG